MTNLLTRLAEFRPFRALLVGDFMLDQHVYGAAERLSPDAPVPVLSVTETRDAPGGASNVALCLRGLLGDVFCLGVVGDDPEGRLLVERLHEAGCDATGLIVDSRRPTTVKRSLVGLAQHRHPQKMFRVDFESKAPLSPEITREILRLAEAQIDQVDIVCIEDYGKGVCTTELCAALVALCRRHGKELLVDPAAIADYSRYRGSTTVTPNRTEAELAIGSALPEAPAELIADGVARRLREALELEAVVLTLDRHGSLVDTRDGGAVHVPTEARHVYDVTGAGDMVLAALAAARANGLDWTEAACVANAAAGLEVEVFGVRPIPLAQVQRELLRLDRGLDGKVRRLDELRVEIAVRRQAGARIVLTNGCFDVIHAGHVAYLREAKAMGDVLIVGINADEQVRAQKGAGRPVYPATERLEILSELQCVDYVIVFAEPTAEALIREVRPDVYAKGGDYAPHEVNEAALLEELGIELRLAGHREGLSSRSVVAKLAATDD